jgi:hypothetical protein
MSVQYIFSIAGVFAVAHMTLNCWIVGIPIKCYDALLDFCVPVCEIVLQYATHLLANLRIK